ncbi:uncharacterized protein BX663DRAFT_499656 [Cokeromyces recurvatus]|uniref:uncharacterized protein n=1 Tax=Cokeromyces recurvatus TaxID=90255 RepID=UPI002220B096|nr:uncharacterized protein BX663DRAFT_499656 [Cokeromyces recurvatus]KAI7905417.1 hypothetical protein BX663DRAFT_499656 [Cokeromyces recurvatus]
MYFRYAEYLNQINVLNALYNQYLVQLLISIQISYLSSCSKTILTRMYFTIPDLCILTILPPLLLME